MGQPNLTRETKLSGANGDRENPIFLVQLTTSRIGNRTRLMPNLLKVTTTHTNTQQTVAFAKGLSGCLYYQQKNSNALTACHDV